MDGKSDNIRTGYLKPKGEKKPAGIENQVVEETYAPDKIKKVKVQSLIDSHLYYTGRSSGEQYEWVRSGAVVEVDERDVPELLDKVTKKSCCGEGRKHIFQLA